MIELSASGTPSLAFRLKGAKQIKLSALSPCALFACCVTIAACSQATELSRLQYTPTVNVLSDRIDRRLSYHVLYNFSVLPDGNEPAAGLIDVDGTLYGTTAWGGGYGHGAAFSITSSGTEKVPHSFGKGTDGYYPQAGLIDVGGTLYGTTEYGGSGSCSNDFYHGCGTVFSITTGGKEKVLHSFSDAGAQGSNPLAGLIDVGGALYGTTFQGGYGGRGTVFRITTGGTEKVLHNFGLGTDGCYPLAALVDVGGTLYGTTYSGGMYGVGTAFSIPTSGVEKVLHSFGNGSDGVFPVAGLIKVNETLYSTTYNGGLHNAGTVFALTP